MVVTGWWCRRHCLYCVDAPNAHTNKDTSALLEWSNQRDRTSPMHSKTDTNTQGDRNKCGWRHLTSGAGGCVDVPGAECEEEQRAGQGRWQLPR